MSQRLASAALMPSQPAENHSGRAQALGRAHDGVPPFRRCCNRQMNGPALFLRDFRGPREEFLFLETEQLFRRQLVLAGARALQESKMQNDDVLLMRIDAIEDSFEVVNRVVVPTPKISPASIPWPL